MKLIKYKDKIVVNLDTVTRIETHSTNSSYSIWFFHHFTYVEENFRGKEENFYETTWYFDTAEELEKVYGLILEKYVDILE